MKLRVAVVGGGVASLAAALRASERHEVTLICAGPLGGGNSVLARGGIQVAQTDAEMESMFEDFVAVGELHVGSRDLRQLVEFSPFAVSLLEQLGVEWVRNGKGTLLLTRAGGMRRASIARTRSPLGPSVIRALVRALSRTETEVRSHFEVIAIEQSKEAVNLHIKDPSGGVSSQGFDIAIVGAGGSSTEAATEFGVGTTTRKACSESLARLWMDRTPMTLSGYQFHPFVFDGGSRLTTIPEDIVQQRGTIRVGDDVVTGYRTRRELVSILAAQAENPTKQVIQVDLPMHELPTFLTSALARSRDANSCERDRWKVTCRPALHYQLMGMRPTVEAIRPIGEFAWSPFGKDRAMGTGLLQALASGWAAAEL